MAELHGEALDRAVAGVLGWTHMVPGPGWQMPEVLHWSDPDGKFVGRLPHFSSDWSRLPEMLQHLMRNDPGRWVCIDTAPDGTDAALWGRGEGPVQGDEGKDVLEAVARLVVAVAEAKDG